MHRWQDNGKFYNKLAQDNLVSRIFDIAKGTRNRAALDLMHENIKLLLKNVHLT